MRCSAKTVFAAVAAISPLVLGYSTDGTSAPSDASLTVLERNQESVLIRFSNDHLRFELKATAQDRACHGAGVFVNGQELVHTRNGSFGYGSGEIPSFPQEDRMILSANWQSLCIPAPSGSQNIRTAQLLGVHIMSAGKTVLRNAVGFTASFSQVGRPKFLRLHTSWLDITSGDLEAEDWRDPEESELLENQPFVEIFDDVEFKNDMERHWKQLQDLKMQVDNLRQQIKGEEHEILKSLQQACPCLEAKWENCRSIRCAFQVSLQKVPDLFRQLRYRFGPFPSSLPKTSCTALEGEDDDCEMPPPTTTSHRNPFPSPPRPSYTGVSDYHSGYSDHIKAIPPSASHQSETKDPIRTAAIVVLVGAVVTFVFLLYRNIEHRKRRRAEIALLREERSACLAYTTAAWRHWCEGTRSRQPARITNALEHDLEERDITDYNQHRHSGDPFEHSSSSGSGSGSGTMESEIQRLRRVFEYVGGLVLNGDRDRGRDLDESRAPLTSALRGGADRTSAPSSGTAPTSMAESPRTSSLLTLDSPRSLTLDTLDTRESDPPSYPGL